MAIETTNVKVDWKGGTVAEGTARGLKLVMDEPMEEGGTNTAMHPVETLLSALGGCMTIVATMFAPKFRVDLKGFSIEVEGDMDSDGFLGKNPDVRVGLSDIRYKMHIVSDSPEENIRRLHKFVETHCPVKDTLKGVSVSGTYVVEG